MEYAIYLKQISKNQFKMLMIRTEEIRHIKMKIWTTFIELYIENQLCQLGGFHKWLMAIQMDLCLSETQWNCCFYRKIMPDEKVRMKCFGTETHT